MYKHCIKKIIDIIISTENNVSRLKYMIKIYLKKSFKSKNYFNQKIIIIKKLKFLKVLFLPEVS